MRRRQLSKTQTTSLARRFAAPTSRKSYFVPTAIPGCQLWLDASDPASIVVDGTNVTSWRDKSGNGYHMNSLTPNAGWSGVAEYPTIGTSINGLQTLSFKAQAGLKQATTLDGVKNLFWVGRIAAPTGTPAGGSAIYFLLGHDSNYDWHGNSYGSRFIDGANSQGGIYGATGSLFTSDANAVTNATFGLMNMPSAPNVSMLSVSGITGNTRYQGICYDRSTHTGWCGDLAEVITFTTALTTAQRQAVEGYLAHKWGLTTYYSPVTPLSIPGCSIWLDSSDASSLTLSGSTVTTWKDKSGNGNNFSSVIGSTSVITDNGKTVVNFSSSDAVMSSTNQVALTTSSAIFVVSKLLSINSSTFGYILALPDVLGYDDYSFRYRSGDSIIGTRAYGGGGVQDIGNGNYYVNGIFDPATGGQFLNKYSVISTIKPSSSGTTKVLLSSSSSSRYYKGYIAEFLYYSGGVTLSQRETIEKYLMHKWGLGIIPSTHPYVNYIPSPLNEFIPRTITGCQLWLDGADPDGTGIVPSAGAKSSWFDKSANGWNASQSVSARQPSLVLNSLNRRPGFSFTSVNNQSFITDLQSSLNTLSGLTVFAVLLPTWSVGQDVRNPAFFGMRKTVSSVLSTKINYYLNNNYASVNIFNGSSVAYHSISGLAQNTAFMYSGTNNNGTNLLYPNGSLTSNSTGASFGSGTSLPIIIGGNNEDFENWQGYIYEAIVFNSVLTTEQRQQVEGYLAQKWGLTSLPSGHPYKSFSPFSVSSVGFLPTLIPGCQLWLDGADTTSITLSGTNVTQWKDKSGNQNHSTSCSATYVNGINGRACMNNPVISGPIANSGSSTVSIFVIATNNRTGNSYDNMIALNVSSITNYYGAGSLFLARAGDSGTPKAYYGFMNGNLSSAFAPAFDTPFMFNVFQTGTTGSTYGNGTDYGSVTTTGSTLTYTNYYIGTCTGGPAWIGNIGEVIIFNKALTTTERQQVESYLAWKWGLQVTLPSDHAYKFAPPSV